MLWGLKKNYSAEDAENRIKSKVSQNVANTILNIGEIS